MKRALILGISGQDGSYLAELLVAKKYEVHGLIRRNSISEHQKTRLEHIPSKIFTHYGDLNETNGLRSLIDVIKPDFIYNLAAQSHVRISFEIPEYTSQTNGLAVLNLLEILRGIKYKGKLYQASSSEMFGVGVDEDGFQRETTRMDPVSPYGNAKLFAFNTTRNYRNSYGIFVSNGILFNHESPRRASNFVTAKVIKTAIEIKLGKKNELYLGNLDSYRDWGHSKDYVKAMTLILEHNKPTDYVVASGVTRSVRDLCKIVFSHLNLEYQDFVKIDEKFRRPQELPYLRGDASKIRKELGWEPRISFEEMIDEMIYFHKVQFENT